MGDEQFGGYRARCTSVNRVVQKLAGRASFDDRDLPAQYAFDERPLGGEPVLKIE